jgi:hypothetical protein
MSSSPFSSSSYLLFRLIKSKIKCVYHEGIWGNGYRVPLVINIGSNWR